MPFTEGRKDCLFRLAPDSAMLACCLMWEKFGGSVTMLVDQHVKAIDSGLDFGERQSRI